MDVDTAEVFIQPVEEKEQSEGALQKKSTVTTWKEILRLNKDLLPMKLMYFFFFGGYSFIFPYLPVFYRYLGMTAQQTGIILGLRTVAQFLGNPLWGAIADKLRRHKLVMLLGMTLSMSFLYSAVFITPSKIVKDIAIPQDCCLECEYNASKYRGPEHLLVVNSSSWPVLLLSPVHDQKACFHNTTVIHPGLPVYRETISNRVLTSISQNVSNCKSIRQEHASVLDVTSCQQHLRLNIFDSKLESCNITNITNFLFCRNGIVPGARDNSGTFVLLFTVTFLGSFFMVFESGMADACVTKYMSKIGRPGDYGKQRIWGGIGWAIGSVLAGLANDEAGKTLQGNKYLTSFSLYLGLTILTMICVYKLHTSHLAGAERPAIFKNLAKVFTKFQVFAFLFALLVMGVSNAFIQIYLFLYLEDLGATNLLMGLSLFVTTCAEIPLMFASGHVIKKIGHKGIFYLVFLAYAIRFLCYSLLPSAWFVLPIELLHGITYGLMWPATTSYVATVAPPGMVATLQGIATATHWALGFVLSGLAGGPIYAKYGAKTVFQGLSLLALISGIIFAISQKVHHVLTADKIKEHDNELAELNAQQKP